MLRATAFALIVSAGLAVAPPAHGAELYTMPLEVASGGDFDCWIVNVSNKPKTVEIYVVNAFSGTVHNSDSKNLGAGQSGVLSSIGNGGTFYCRFVVPGGKNSYRAGAAVWQAGVGNIAAAPAQ